MKLDNTEALGNILAFSRLLVRSSAKERLNILFALKQIFSLSILKSEFRFVEDMWSINLFPNLVRKNGNNQLMLKVQLCSEICFLADLHQTVTFRINDYL